MRKLHAALVAAVVLMGVADASAQTFLASGPAISTEASVTAAASSAQAATVRRSSRRKSKPGLRFYGIFERQAMSAGESFGAVLGTSTFTLKGAGADVTDIWRSVFVRVAATHDKAEGQRLFVATFGQFTPLNIPLTVEMSPLEVGGGWRFGAMSRRQHVVPYLGVTGVWLHYKETSPFAEPGENTDETFAGTSMFGGVDVGISFVRLAVEGLYRRVPNALGETGVSKTFGETGLGGAVVRFAFGIGF